MPIDYGALSLPKGRPAKLAKADRTKAREDIDKRENVKVKARSGGRCEIHWRYEGSRTLMAARCQRRSVPGVHHMIGGWGKRARGNSLLAEHKQDVCTKCHSDITGKVLRRVGGELPLWSDTYERVQ